MPRYVGLDVHKNLIEACFIDEQGKQLHRCGVAVTRESIQTFTAKAFVLYREGKGLDKATLSEDRCISRRVQKHLGGYMAHELIGDPDC